MPARPPWHKILCRISLMLGGEEGQKVQIHRGDVMIQELPLGARPKDRHVGPQGSPKKIWKKSTR